MLVIKSNTNNAIQYLFDYAFLRRLNRNTQARRALNFANTGKILMIVK